MPDLIRHLLRVKVNPKAQEIDYVEIIDSA